MSGDVLAPPPPPPKRNGKDRLAPIAGKITHLLGTGENAQFSIVYKTISWSFAAAGISSIIVVSHILYKNNGNVIEALKGIWAIFIPVITLSLGYIFGKSR